MMHISFALLCRSTNILNVPRIMTTIKTAG